MTQPDLKNIGFLHGRSSLRITQEIVKSLWRGIIPHEVFGFADGEIEPQLLQSVRWLDEVFVVHTLDDVANNFFELGLLVDAVRRAGQNTVSVVIPYMGLTRQDKRGKKRVPIGAKFLTRLIDTLQLNRVLLTDLHSPQIQGFFNHGEIVHTYGSQIFANKIQGLLDTWVIDREKLIFIAADASAALKARYYTKRFNTIYFSFDKNREKPNEVDKLIFTGNPEKIKGADLIVVDDIIDTAGTLCAWVEQLHEMWARSINALMTHVLSNGPAKERIDASHLDKVYTLDTIYKERNMSDKVEVLETASFFAKLIEWLCSGASLNELKESYIQSS